MIGQKTIVDRVLWWCFAVVIALRIAMPRLFGLLDDESVDLLNDSWIWATKGGWTLNNTLPAFLISQGYKLFGPQLPSARWISVLSGLGVMLILFLHGLRTENRSAGMFSALFFGILPLSLYYGTSELPYNLLTFLGFLGLWLFFRAVSEDRLWCGFLAGLSWGGAFLCHTAGAAFAIPGFIWFVWRKAKKSSSDSKEWIAPLLALMTWSFAMLAVIAWRWPIFGTDIFHDFRMRNLSFSGSPEWNRVANLHSLMLPILIPGLALALKRGFKTTFDRLAVLYLLLISILFLLHPGSFFPGLLLPLTPVLAWFAGRELAELFRAEEPSGALPAWALVAGLCAASILIWPAWLDYPQAWIMPASTVLALIIFILAQKLPGHYLAAAKSKFTALILIGATFFGCLYAYGSLDTVEKYTGARLDAIRLIGLNKTILGGGRVLNLLGGGVSDYPEFSSLPLASQQNRSKSDLPSVLREFKIGSVIVDERKPSYMDGALEKFQVGNIVGQLDADPFIERPFDNGWFAVYLLEDVPLVNELKWPDWNRVDAQWVRTRFMAKHPTPLRLRIISWPRAHEPIGAVIDRKIIIEFTSRPGISASYTLELKALGQQSQTLWFQNIPVVMEKHEVEPGILLKRVMLDREGGMEPDTLIIPGSIKSIQTIEARIVSVRGVELLRDFVRIPPWW